MAYAAARYFAPRYFAPRYFDTDSILSGFPTQYAGLRYFDNGSIFDLCLVAAGDAPGGDTPFIDKNGTTYAIYLVDPADPDASTIRVHTNDGTKAIRLKT